MSLFSRPSFFSLLAWLAFASRLLAHDPGLSNAVVSIEPEKIVVHLTFAPSDLGDNARDPAKLKEVAARAILWKQSQAENKPVPPVVAQAVTHPTDTQVTLQYPRQAATFQFQLFPELPFGHRQFLSIRCGEKILRERMLSAGSEAVEITAADLQSAPAVTAIDDLQDVPAAPSTISGFFRLGVEHILTGYDHLLFLLGLLLVCTRLAPALVCITCFTLAHSITLAASVLGWFSLPSHIVEPLIAASILYIGIENCFPAFHLRRRAVLTFLFGLVHGLGFAGILNELGIAQRPEGVLAPLLGFNLGVEAGQIAIAAIVLPVLLALQKNDCYRRCSVPALSVLVALAGGYWLVERTLW